MKIQKGKVSTSNGVMIAVLVIVFYLVMPGGSDKKTTSSADQTPEASTSANPSNSSPASDTNSSLKAGEATAQGLLTDTKPVPTAPPTLRALPGINADDLEALKGQNPFFTTIIVAEKETSHVAEQVSSETAAVSIAPIPPTDAIIASKISLIYESTTGQQAAVLNRKIVYPGTLINDDNMVQSISRHGIQLSSIPISADKE